jgi:hypothetical protein
VMRGMEVRAEGSGRYDRERALRKADRLGAGVDHRLGDKTKVVYCPQDGRNDPFGTTSFTFLG